jgi:periplasmic protein TonB
MIMKPGRNREDRIESFKGLFFHTGLVIALALSLLAFEWKSVPKRITVTGKTEFGSEVDFYVPPSLRELPKPPSPAKIIEAIEIVDNSREVDFDPGNFDSEAGKDMLIDIVPVIINNQRGPDAEEEILIRSEQMPEFPGGGEALVRFIQRALKYPPIAQETGIEGRVFVRFVIDREGNVTDVQLVRGVDQSIDNEALRVVRSLPRWEPGRQNGKTVKVWYTVPIVFKLQQL